MEEREREASEQRDEAEDGGDGEEGRDGKDSGGAGDGEGSTSRPVIIFSHALVTEAYLDQKKRWPSMGRFILAQYTDEAILVYQSFKREIGRYAVENKRFTGCPEYSTTRMTWIKTNFLWMMFRNRWGEKKNQDMTLGIWLKRSAFHRYILISARKEEIEDERRGATVRLQWDPDHDPSGAPLKNRRAIQLGLKNMRSFSDGEDILRIDDMSQFVKSCNRNDLTKLITPKEIVYAPDDRAVLSVLGLSRESKSTNNKGDESGPSGEDPLRITLCYKNRRKVVVLQPRILVQLNSLIHQKYGIKASSVSDNKGKEITDKELKTLAQDTVLNVS